jgi:hypothetical protein
MYLSKGRGLPPFRQKKGEKTGHGGDNYQTKPFALAELFAIHLMAVDIHCS